MESGKQFSEICIELGRLFFFSGNKANFRCFFMIFANFTFLHEITVSTAAESEAIVGIVGVNTESMTVVLPFFEAIFTKISFFIDGAIIANKN